MNKKTISTLLIISLLFGNSIPISAAETSSEKDYYSEITYYTGEELENITPFSIDDSTVELVAAVEQTVFVSETKNDNGEVIDSHLMNEEEVKEYRALLNSPTTCDSTYLGSDNDSKGELTISLQVFRDENKEFRAYGKASWTYGIYDGNTSTTPAVGDDFIALTWGGNGNLVQTSKSINGTYQYSGNNISFSRAESNSYQGYCWQFAEKSGAYFMNNLNCYVELGRVNSTLQGKETAIRLTYIHTYQSTTGTVSFSPSSAGIATSVELSSTPSSWQIEVDIPGINY